MNPDAALPDGSYPTFWDAIPVEPAVPAATPAVVPDAPDANTLFTDVVEGTRPVTLWVEQADVG